MEETPGYGRSERSASPGRGRSRRPALSVQWPLLSHQGDLRCVRETKPPSAESDLGNLYNSVIRFTPIGSEGWVARTAGHLGHDTNCDHPVNATMTDEKRESPSSRLTAGDDGTGANQAVRGHPRAPSRARPCSANTPWRAGPGIASGRCGAKCY
jgi:hypothetical protein